MATCRASTLVSPDRCFCFSAAKQATNHSMCQCAHTGLLLLQPGSVFSKNPWCVGMHARCIQWSTVHKNFQWPKTVFKSSGFRGNHYIMQNKNIASRIIKLSCLTSSLESSKSLFIQIKLFTCVCVCVCVCFLDWERFNTFSFKQEKWVVTASVRDKRHKNKRNIKFNQKDSLTIPCSQSRWGWLHG